MSRDTVLGIDERYEAMLCYSLGFLTGFLFYVLEEENAFVRFHAAQSVVVFGGIYVASLLLNFLLYLPLPLRPVYGLVASLLSVVSLLLWVLLMVKAYRGEWYKLPVAGELAARHS